jgi:hypothetical protein
MNEAQNGNQIECLPLILNSKDVMIVEPDKISRGSEEDSQRRPGWTKNVEC